MEKTLKYNLDESYAQGYNDAREEIIKKIAEVWQKTDNSSNLTYADGLADATDIARGQK